MRDKKVLFILFLFLSMLLFFMASGQNCSGGQGVGTSTTAPPAAPPTTTTSSGSVFGSGQQIAGSPGINARLIGSPFTVPWGGTIVSVQCTGAGFWVVNDRGRQVLLVRPATNGIGQWLPAGTYWVYPLLYSNQARARVTIRVNW